MLGQNLRGAARAPAAGDSDSARHGVTVTVTAGQRRHRLRRSSPGPDPPLEVALARPGRGRSGSAGLGRVPRCSPDSVTVTEIGPDQVRRASSVAAPGGPRLRVRLRAGLGPTRTAAEIPG